jgi:predicted enzyme related to lactoylglutathione lyase
MVQLKSAWGMPSVSTQHRISRPRFKQYISVGFALILFAFTGCAPANKAYRLELTPVTDTPTGEHHPGKFVWDDLLTDNVDAAKDFYGQLFGWTFEQSGEYTVIKNNGTNIGGMVQIKGDSEHPSVARWLCELSVADVDKAVAMLSEKGGIIHEGPLEYLNRGRGAFVSDPQGAQLFLLYATGGDPDDEEPALGSWLWHELWSNKVADSLAFYQELVGYDFTGEMTDYLILTKDEQWRAGIRYVENNELEMRWVPVVRVADTDDVAERAKQLGGKVLVEPRPTESGGSVALLSDPSDALLIIQRWTAPSPGQEN